MENRLSDIKFSSSSKMKCFRNYFSNDNRKLASNNNQAVIYVSDSQTFQFCLEITSCDLKII